MLTDQKIIQIQDLFGDFVEDVCKIIYKPPPDTHIDFTKIGINGGPEWDRYEPANHPGKIFNRARLFWLMEKDYDKKNPKDYTPVVCDQPCGQISCTPWEGSFASNKNRLCRAKDVFKEVTISPEVIFHNGSKQFPNKHFSMEEWGTAENARVWMRHFLMSCANICDVVEVGNEPWGYAPSDWLALERAFVEEFVERTQDMDKRPLLSTAAVPVGEGKPFWRGTLEQFVNFPADYDIMQFHAYATQHGQWVDDSEVVINQIKEAQEFHARHMPNAQLRLTEVGFPNTAGNQMKHIEEVLNYCAQQGDAIDAVFLYRLTFQENEGLFAGTELLDKDENTSELYRLMKTYSEAQAE